MWLLNFFKRKQKPDVLITKPRVLHSTQLAKMPAVQSGGYVPVTRASDVPTRSYDPTLDFMSPLSPYSPLNPIYDTSEPARSSESSSCDSGWSSDSSSSSSYDSGSSSSCDSSSSSSSSD